MQHIPAHLLSFQQTGRSQHHLAGGKGANLGELRNIPGINVPDGCIISTSAYKEWVAGAPLVSKLVDQLAGLNPADRERIAELGAGIRSAIETIAIPPVLVQELEHFLAAEDSLQAYAIRSSATAEDLPGASFAGQQDSYLNISGKDAILRHISRCWASLFTERAIIYRLQQGFDHRQVQLAVVIQKMVLPEAAGILFTADPVTSNRKVVSIDAGFGLGEALVSGLVSADNYKVRDGGITARQVSTKKMAIYALEMGGTAEKEVEPEKQVVQVLTDAQILELAALGRKIEAHFGSPQDIEWCLAGNTFYIVQSRPITTLFPIPEAADNDNHVYISVGHQQMMTDAMKPLGLSFFMLMSGGHMRQAGNRLFVDVSRQLASPAARNTLINALGQSDPLLKDALQHIVARDFIALVPDETDKIPPVLSSAGFRTQFNEDTSLIRQVVTEREAEIAALNRTIAEKSGPEVFDLIKEDMARLRTFLFDREKLGIIMAAIDAAVWINKHILEWLGEKNAADTLSLSVSGNITSEMGLELLDVADVIRPFPEVIACLQKAEDPDFPEQLPNFEGGAAAREAICAFLDKYGMRCAGEIDISRSRWAENPLTLIPLLLSNVKNFGPGAGKQKFEQGRQLALQKEEELLGRLKQLPDGGQKAVETKRMIDLVRNFSGYREYPKYWWVNHFFAYKKALLKEARQMVQAGLITNQEDVFFLSFPEFEEAVRSGQVDQERIDRRKEEYRLHEKLAPPRIMTSEGEVISGAYNLENLPQGALPGLAVSTGVIEGRARVILRMEDADLEEGDILVTAFTDPSWTPLFVSVKGLVTEVGGLMTHGAVIAREYGLPAVVGVERATQLITDGQRIRVNGTNGFVELL